MSTASMSDPLVGRVLDGRYEVLAKLARGGMATVYRAHDRRLTRTVAVKVMHDGLGDDAEFAKKFDREARHAATLSNPHVVSVFDQGIDDGRPYIVMEFVQGCTLRHIITREAPLAPLRALDLMEPVISALSSAHEAGLVHRDVKPENVLISDRGQIKVADFGLTRAITAQTATATQGLLIGTVSYLPPELVVSGRADARSDVYSAGVVLFEMLTGSKPHQGESPIQVAYSHVHNDIPAPSTLLAGNDPRSMDSRRIIPPYLDALVMACTRRQPDLRPSDGREMLQLLRTARRALSNGILDDPALTDQMGASMYRPMVANSDEESTQTLLSDSTLTETIGATTTQGLVPSPDAVRPTRGMTSVHARTPSSPPQDTADEWPYADADPAGRREPVAAPRPRPRPRQEVAQAHVAAEAHRRVIRRRRGLVALVLLMVLTLGAAGGTYWWFSEGRWQVMPGITNTTRTDAEKVSSANGLQITFVEEYSETVPKGLVISSTPSQGDRILKEGGQVVAVISKGPERYTVPKVVGSSRDEASAALTKAKLTVGEVSEAWSETVAEGAVIKASLAPGASVKKGTSVDLTISKGREPIEIADQSGKDVKTATAALSSKGFVVSATQQFSDEVAEGKVISQSPANGTGHRKDTITLVVSKGPEKIDVPEVLGKSEAQARKLLTDAGFAVKVNYASPAWIRMDVVRSTSPLPGVKAKKGSEITIWVL